MEPEKILAILNIASGLYSAFQGVMKSVNDKESTKLVNSSNPLIYIAGGLLTAAIGLTNWWSSVFGLIGTGVFIVASLINAWYGIGKEGPKKLEFWTLNGYAITATILVVLTLLGIGKT